MQANAFDLHRLLVQVEASGSVPTEATQAKDGLVAIHDPTAYLHLRDGFIQGRRIDTPKLWLFHGDWNHKATSLH